MGENKRLIRALNRHGYTVSRGGSGHYKIRDKNGFLVSVTSFSPGGFQNNFIAQFKRVTGIDLRKEGFR